MEREVIRLLNFKLLPDTLYFWFELAVKLWDVFVEQEAAHFDCTPFKPMPLKDDPNKYVAKNNPFQLSSPYGKYRVAVQALDLATLHY